VKTTRLMTAATATSTSAYSTADAPRSRRDIGFVSVTTCYGAQPVVPLPSPVPMAVHVSEKAA
jgi:hypothetical protein